MKDDCVVAAAQNYAVLKIKTPPAQNPSYWIRGTKIDRSYEKTGGPGLPQRNESESKLIGFQG